MIYESNLFRILHRACLLISSISQPFLLAPLGYMNTDAYFMPATTNSRKGRFQQAAIFIIVSSQHSHITSDLPTRGYSFAIRDVVEQKPFVVASLKSSADDV